MRVIHLTPVSCSSGKRFAFSAFAFQPCDFSCSGNPIYPVRLSPDRFIPSLSGFVPKCPKPVRITALAHARLPFPSCAAEASREVEQHYLLLPTLIIKVEHPVSFLN